GARLAGGGVRRAGPQTHVGVVPGPGRPHAGGGRVTRATTLAAPRRRVEATAAVTVGAAVFALYLPVLRDLVGVWLQVPYYSYGFVVPLFSAYLAWDVF